MTVSNAPIDSQSPLLPAESWAEDEIDLRQYIWVLVAWWREIVTISMLCAILGAAVVIGLRFIQDPVYEASAAVAIARTTSNISFDARFQTDLAGENRSSNSSTQLLDASARRSALLGLVYNGAVAETVSKQLVDILEEKERNPSAFDESH